MANKTDRPSESTEKYLGTIFRLTRHRGVARVKHVATEMKMTQGTVSGALKRLKAAGYIEHAPYRSIRLTPSGWRIGEDIERRNRILTAFLGTVLSMEPEEAKTAADHMRYAVDKNVIDAMRRLLDIKQRNRMPEYQIGGTELCELI